MPYKQSEAAAAAAVVLCVAMSEAERLIYDCCGAAGLFLGQLRCATAYLRLCLQLMDDWSRPPTAPRAGGEGGRRGRGESSGPPVVEHKPTDLRHTARPKTPQADKTQHAALRPLLQAGDYFKVRRAALLRRLQRELCLLLFATAEI